VASLQKKVKNGRAYWYVTEVARVNGNPRIVNQRYLGTVEAIEAAFDAAFEPDEIDSVEFGLSATMWSLASRLGFGLTVDASCPKRNQGLTVGTYLQAAAVNRAVVPRSKRAFYSWYSDSVLSRVVPADDSAWTSQRFWDAMDRVEEDVIDTIEQQLVSRAIDEFDIDASALVFDTTNFHTFIATTNARNTIAKRGRSKQKRHDLRLVGLALACSTDHHIPLASKLLAGNTPDVRAFEAALPELIARLEAVGVDAASVTLVFDKGNNSKANLPSVDASGIGFVGSLVPSQHDDLLAVADDDFGPVAGIDGIVAYRTQKKVFGKVRTIVVTRSDDFLAKQLVGLAQTRARVETQLEELDRLLAGKRHRMDAAKLKARVNEALSPRWIKDLYRYEITGERRDELDLSWAFDDAAFDALKERELGKRIIFTDRHQWSTEDIVISYRSQWEVEAAFRQIKDPRHVAFRPIYHWTDQKIKVHGLYSVAALMLVQLAWREAKRSGLDLSPTEVMDALSAIRETTLLYPPSKGLGKPRVLQKLTRIDHTQKRLFELFDLDAFAPRTGNTAKWRGF
jgi:Transposase